MGFRNALERPGPWFEPKGDFGEGCSGDIPEVDEMCTDGANVVELSAHLISTVTARSQVLGETVVLGRRLHRRIATTYIWLS